jgi:sugar O-acyltransferase (sialic acid O-acetyltransferase NeuD family)
VDVVIIGAGGHASVIFDSLTSGDGDRRVVGFVDVDASKHGQMLGVPVVGNFDTFRTADVRHFAMGIGNNGARGREFTRLRASGLEPVTVIHRSAVISRLARVGVGTVAMANVVVNNGADIGEDVILNTGCSIDHHCVVGPHAHIAPGAVLAGAVTVGDYTLIGAGAVVIPGVRIGSRCTIAAGAAITRDVPDGTLVAGVPGIVKRG